MKKHWLISLCLVVAIMATLQIPNRTRLGDPDGFYHAKASQLLEQGNLSDTFPYLAYTTWKDGYADQHYLYHALLIPFNNVDSLFLSIIIFASLAALAFYLLFSVLMVKSKLWWLLILMLGSTDFLFRINLVKANTLSLASLAAIIYLLWKWHEKNNYWVAAAIGVVSFLFVWIYGGFVFVPVVLALYVLSVLITERKFDYLPGLASALGIVIGLLVHPHNSHLLVLLYDQIFRAGLGAGAVPVGNEWLPFNIDWFLTSNIPLLLVWVLSLAAVMAKIWHKQISWLELWLQLIAVALLLLTLRHRRFIEYFTPFAVLSASVVLTPYLAKLNWQQIKLSIKQHWQLGFSAGFVVFLVASAFLYNFQHVYDYLQGGEETHRFEEVAQQIYTHSQPGDIVINTQWDQFPQLFYWNSKSYYPIGLDPTFMYIYNADLYWDLRKIADDNESDWESVEYLHSIASKTLKGKFLFLDANRNINIHKYIQEHDTEQKYFQLIYDLDNVVAYRILP